MKSIIKLPYIYMALLACFLVQSNSTLAHFGSKGPFGGSVTCGITYDSLVFVGTTNGGVYFSTKQALTGWSAKPVGLKSGKITAIAHTGSYIFSATADSGIFRFTGYIGTDRYWEKVNTGLTNLKIKSLVAIDSITLLAGTAGGGIFKTTNKGASWTTVNSGISGTATITGLVKAGNRIIASSKSGGLFKSDNNGTTWSDFNDVNTLGIAGTNAISYNAITNELLVVNNTGLFIISSASTANIFSYVASQTSLPLNTAIRSISNNGSNWYLATDKGIYTSVTGAISWTSATANLSTLDVNVVIPIPFQSSRLIAGTNKVGMFTSPANAILWTENNVSFNNLVTYSAATSGALVIAVATEKGVFTSKDLASTYQRANRGLTDSLNVTGLEFLGTNLFAGTKNAGIFASADTGKTWSAFNTGLIESNIKNIVTSGNTLYIISSTNMVYQSNGFSWVQIQSGLPVNVKPTSFVTHGDVVFMGTSGAGVYTKLKSANTWMAINTGLIDLNVTSLTESGGKLFAGTNGSGVFITDAASVSWVQVANPSIDHTTIMGLDGMKIQAMATYGSFVLASYKGGLLATTDNGATWMQAGNQFNLPSYTNVNKIALVDSRVFVTTDNNGLYSNSLAEFPLFAVTNVSANVSCNGSCNGVAFASASGGAGPYTYLWSTGATTSSVTNLCAQTYTVIVSGAGIIKDTTTVTISEPNVLAAVITSTEASMESMSDGTASAVVSGGTAPYNYLWSTSETTDNIAGLATGDYSLFVTDANGCDLVKNTTVTFSLVPTGIDIVSDNIGIISVSPNPNNGIFTIGLKNVNSTLIQVSITDIIGKEMQYSVINNTGNQTMSVNYPAGIYFVKIVADDKTVVQKMVIQ